MTTYEVSEEQRRHFRENGYVAGDYGRDPEDYSIINVMLPRRYYPDWQGNVFESRASNVAQQLCGDVTVHNENVMHRSGGNQTNGFRRAYILAFRPIETIKIERELGFTHSHNDDDDVLDGVGVAGETR